MKTPSSDKVAPRLPGLDPAKWDLISCAFCNAKGTDPFNLLSERSPCESCHGRGVVPVPRPHIRCTFCSGTGSDKTYRCPACRGAGAVGVLAKPSVVCQECDGSGFTLSGGLECLLCRGQGFVPAPAPITTQ
jgi:DnaJ-class molecular chaperone